MDPVRTFFGLNNVSDPLQLGLQWLKTADNVLITKHGRLSRRGGQSLALAFTSSGAYSSIDFQRLYIVDAGVLKQVVNDDMDTVTLATGLSTDSMRWTEINDQVFFTNGTDSGVILKDGTVLELAWGQPTMPDLVAIAGALPAGVYQVACTYILADGRETGASDAAAIYLDGTQSLQINNIPQVSGLSTQVYIAPADSTVFQLAFETTQTSSTWNSSNDELGADLVTQFLGPLPQGCTYLTIWGGQLCAAQYLTGSDTTVIWISEPLGFHLFNLKDGFVMVPGQVSMLADANSALIIATESAIFAYDGENMNELASYGVVPGFSNVVDEDKTVLFWSKRGTCRAMPFVNLTQEQISVAPGLQAGAAIVSQNGEKQYVVALQRGGAAFNQRS